MFDLYTIHRGSRSFYSFFDNLCDARNEVQYLRAMLGIKAEVCRVR